jgi:quinol monooxygenase YgiN
MTTTGTAGATQFHMVRLTIALTATSTRSAQELRDALRFLALGTRLESGCLSCSAWASPDFVHYVEEWMTEADMRRRVRSESFVSLLGILDAAKEPRVQFDFVTSTRGLDYVAEVRADLLIDGPANHEADR